MKRKLKDTKGLKFDKRIFVPHLWGNEFYDYFRHIETNQVIARKTTIFYYRDGIKSSFVNWIAPNGGTCDLKRCLMLHRKVIGNHANRNK